MLAVKLCLSECHEEGGGAHFSFDPPPPDFLTNLKIYEECSFRDIHAPRLAAAAIVAGQVRLALVHA